MLLIPAIDLKEGRCVRLKQGLMEQATVFSDSPAEMALHWRNQGARRLHLVDLNGAFAGVPQNFPAIKEILAAVAKDIPVQLGGGIRDLGTIEKVFGFRADRCDYWYGRGENPEFVREAVRHFGSDYCRLGCQRRVWVAIDGWATVTEHHVVDLAKRFEDDGVNSIIYTDIGRDGMMSGVNIEATVKLAQSVNIPIIASGGLTNLDDIHALCAVEKEGVSGAITGRAIYEGSIDFAQAQKLADSLA